MDISHAPTKENLSRLFTALLFVGCLCLLWEVGFRAWIEFQPTYQGDGSLYWAMGRGILDGRIPYKDLFDFRPPGIFLLAALSVKLTGGNRLGTALEALITVLLVILPVAAIWKKESDRDSGRPLLILSGCLFASFVSLYTMIHGGLFRVESFASFSIVLYAILLHKTDHLNKIWRVFILALLIFIAIGFREPYLFVAFIIASLLSNSRKEFESNFIFPATAAILMFIAALASTGWLKPFIGLYQKTLFHYLIGALKREAPGHSAYVLKSAVLMGLHPVRMFSSFQRQFAIVIGTLPLVLTWIAPFPVRFQIRTYRFWIAFFLMATSTFVAFGSPHVTVMMIPAYLALFLLVEKTARKTWERFQTRRALYLWAVILAVFGLFSFIKPVHEYHYENPWRRHVANVAAQKVDAIIDRCGAKYAYIGTVTNGPLVPTLTRHSPSGAIFFQFHHFLKPGFPLRSRFFEGLRNADFIVRDNESWNGTNYLMVDPYKDTRSEIQLYLDENFTTTPWKCAVGLAENGYSYDFLFRKKL